MNDFSKISLPTVKHIIAIASGKGGVGKSTVAANLAIAIAHEGYKAALIDADLFGPSIPTMFGSVSSQIFSHEIDGKELLVPVEKFGVKLMSSGFLLKPDNAIIWRGPLAANALIKLFTDTYWGEIDYLIVDLPPGTSDIPLTLCQQIDFSGVIIVTTPQLISLIDVRKAISLFINLDLKQKILGVIENMSWFTPLDHPEEKYFLFGKGGGEILAREHNTMLLAQIPIVDGMAEASDNGSFQNYQKSDLIQNLYKEVVNKILLRM